MTKSENICQLGNLKQYGNKWLNCLNTKSPSIKVINTNNNSIQKKSIPKRPVKKQKVKRTPTDYNLYMKDCIPQKKIANPNMQNTEIFKNCAINYKKNKKK